MTNADTLRISTPTEREVVIARDFDAPRQLVFDAWTKPELLRRWMLAPGRSMEVCKIDLKAGGAYRFVWRGPGKSDVGMYGVYREVVPPERIVRTEAWEDWDAGEVLVTISLLERGAKTQMTETVLFPSLEVRDAVLKSGLEQGARGNFGRLAGVLASVPSG